MFHCKLPGHAGPQAADRQLRRDLRDRAGGGPAGIPMVQKTDMVCDTKTKGHVQYICIVYIYIYIYITYADYDII